MEEAKKLNLNEAQYVNHLCQYVKNFSTHVLFHSELSRLVPDNPLNAKPTEWIKKSEASHLKEVLQKFSNNEYWLIQSAEQTFYTKIQMPDDGLTEQLYKKTKDYTFSIMLGLIFNNEINNIEMYCDANIRKILETSFIETIEWINSDLSDFNEYYTSLLIEKLVSRKELSPDEIFRFVNCICYEIYINYDKIDLYDSQLFNPATIPEKAIEINLVNKASPGILITTSSSGGCHKTIAANVHKELQEQKINSGVLNTSILTENDVLKRFIGISHSQLYPIVHQQNGLAGYRKKLVELNDFLYMFDPDDRPFMTRSAINMVKKSFSINTMYVTSHHKFDMRFLPSGARVFYQICDYGSLPEAILNMANTVTNYAPNSKLKFIIPDQSISLEDNKKPSKDRSSKEFTINTLFPTNVLTEAVANELFQKTIDEQGLRKDDKVIRCVISMGGYGCGNLIQKYLQEIIMQYSIQNRNEPFEVCVICGNNEELKNALKKEYGEGGLLLGKNISIKILGFIPNKQYISLAMHSVPIIKPGGGTSSECIQNKISAMIHLDPDHPWEGANADAMIKRGLGKVIQTETLLEDIFRMHDKLKEKKRPTPSLLKVSDIFKRLTNKNTTKKAANSPSFSTNKKGQTT